MLNVAGSSVVAPSRVKFGAVLRATAGNFLEMFDFFLFGIYAQPIGKTFFNTGSEFTDTLIAFVVFWIGALMRPLGAVYLGAYVDSIGRRKGLILTLSIMAIGTVIIAVTPGYATIGVAAPIIVVAGRLLQGFSAGVELGGVSVYLAEIATPKNRGFVVSFQSASQQVAVFVAALIGYVINLSLPTDRNTSVGLAHSFRHRLFDRAADLRAAPLAAGNSGISGAQSVTRRQQRFIARWRPTPERSPLGMLMVMLTTVAFYFITVYTPAFGKALNLSASDALLVTLMVAVANFVWLPIGGALSDRYGRPVVLFAAATLMLIAAWPALNYLAPAPTFAKLVAVEMIFSLGYGLYNGAMVVALTELVPAALRASAFSLAYALAAALFGNATPAIATGLIGWTGDKAAPAFWLIIAAAASIFAATMFYRRGARM